MKLKLYTFLFIAVSIKAFSQSNIVITEINYNNPGNDSLEYVELYNKGGIAINLNGYYFSSGIDYVFGNYTLNPGSYVVLSRFSSFVNSFYGISSIQWTSGALDNAGEKIVIKDPSGNIVDSVEYEDEQPWDQAADGTGPSLILCDPNQDNSLGYHWTASSQFRGFFMNEHIIFGSPGAGNVSCNAPGEIFPPKIRKAVAVSPSVVKIKFNEPVGLSSSQNVYNYTGLGTITSAVRSASMDSVTLTLFTPLPIGYVDTLYVSNISDTSGNVMASIKKEIIVYNNTLADLIISEILYNPPGKDTLEFIELYNRGGSTAILGGYKFTDGVDFMFPDITLNPGEFIVVSRYPVLFNNFFSTSYNLQFEGGLNNAGEKLTIKNTVGDVIDSLTFLPSWQPVTDPGPSLVLCDLNSDNNDGANWGASGRYAGNYEGFPIYASPGLVNTECNPLSLKKSENVLFNIYPNPVRDGKLVFEFNNASEKVINLMDVNGKVIYSASLSEQKSEIDLHIKVQGIYILQVVDIQSGTYESRQLVVIAQ